MTGDRWCGVAQKVGQILTPLILLHVAYIERQAMANLIGCYAYRVCRINQEDNDALSNEFPLPVGKDKHESW